MRLTTPTVFIGRMKSYTRRDANRFFWTLSGDDAVAGLVDGQLRRALGIAASRPRPSP
jgi:hypothetical protein